MDICSYIICPGNICPYQQYLSCYRPDFDQTSKSGTICSRCQHVTWRHLSLLAISQLLLNEFWTKLFLPNIFLELIFSGPDFFWNLELFYGNIISDPIWLNQTCLVPNNFWTLNLLGSKTILDQNVFWQKKPYFNQFFLPKFLEQNCFP